MLLKRLILSVAMVGVLGTAAFVAREVEPPGSRMASAASAFLAALEPEQKSRAVFTFDDKERFRWFFTPQQAMRKSTRKGLPLADMTDAQKDAARNLLRAGTSEAGFAKATTVMSLESILADLEKKGAIVRDPAWYFFSVFGNPTRTGRWGWRVEGHHLSLNFTVEGGQVVSATPFFLGSNPAEVRGGAKKGLVPLPETIKPYRDLVDSLGDDQRKLARQAKLFPEIEEGKQRTSVGEPVGIPAAKLADEQKKVLWKLIEGYAQRMPSEVAMYELDEIRKADMDTVHFAYAQDESRPGKPYSYRVQGPTFVIEFLNEQGDSAGNPANHIHSSWRNRKGDFGLARP
ncbi:MAG: DUF3500 domain-containing protein [Gemmataceae bacterium]